MQLVLLSNKKYIYSYHIVHTARPIRMAASNKGATIAEATYPAHIDAKHFGSPHKLLDHLHHLITCAQAPNKIVKRDIGFLPFQSIKGFCGVSPSC